MQRLNVANESCSAPLPVEVPPRRGWLDLVTPVILSGLAMCFQQLALTYGPRWTSLATVLTRLWVWSGKARSPPGAHAPQHAGDHKESAASVPKFPIIVRRYLAGVMRMSPNDHIHPGAKRRPNEYDIGQEQRFTQPSNLASFLRLIVSILSSRSVTEEASLSSGTISTKSSGLLLVRKPDESSLCEELIDLNTSSNIGSDPGTFKARLLLHPLDKLTSGHSQGSSHEIVHQLNPTNPLLLLHPRKAAEAAQCFAKYFPGRTMFAVKANPCPRLLSILYENGITWFDVASINEIREVSLVLSNPTMCFMHPVKAEEAIREAYFDFDIRVFSLDSMSELEKIVRATSNGSQKATDLTLCVRVCVPSQHPKLSLDAKFGVSGQEAMELLIEAHKASHRLGVCFHVGSQAMAPSDYRLGLRQVHAMVMEAGVPIDIIDVGGGFPVQYPTLDPPELSIFFKSIQDTFNSLTFVKTPELWAEPGRAVSAKYNSIVVRVEKRRANELFINDGAYGTLFDAAYLKWRFKARLLREPPSTAEEQPFSLYGPTCDSLDYMPGPFDLPGDVRDNDYLEILDVGAYGWTMRPFNGFHSYGYAVVGDPIPNVPVVCSGRA